MAAQNLTSPTLSSDWGGSEGYNDKDMKEHFKPINKVHFFLYFSPQQNEGGVTRLSNANPFKQSKKNPEEHYRSTIVLFFLKIN